MLAQLTGYLEVKLKQKLNPRRWAERIYGVKFFSYMHLESNKTYECHDASRLQKPMENLVFVFLSLS